MFVLSVLIVLDVLLFLPQEMMLRLKNKISKMNKIFFIFSSIPKVKYYGLVRRTLHIYQNRGDYSRIGEFLGGCLTVKN